MNLVILLISLFGYFSSDAGDIMKDGHMWKTVQINAYLQSSGNVYDSLTLFDSKWDSILNSKCGENYRPATLGDYWSTQFEYMEHIGILYYYAGTNMGVGQAPYQMVSTSTDTIVGGWNQYKSFTKRLTIEPKLANLPVNQYTTAGYSKYDSVNNIPFNHYQQIIAMQPTVNIACVSIKEVKPRTVDTVTNTLHVTDTTYIVDTLRITIHDTLKVHDTLHALPVVLHDTVKLIDVRIVIDTLKLIQHDTIFKTIIDTLRKIDTFNIIQHDTINTCYDGTFAKYSEKLFTSIGSSTNNNPITISETSGNSPSVEVETNTDIEVEVYVYDNLGVAVTSGTYTIKSSTNKQYISFNGYAKNGVKVPNGVYLMRIASGHNNMISNNVYRIGIRNRVAN